MRGVVEVVVVEDGTEVEGCEKRRGEESRPKTHQLLPYIITETAAPITKRYESKEEEKTAS